MRFLVVALLAAMILAASAAAAEAGLTESVDFTAKYVKAGKKKFGGLTLRTTISIRDDAGAKPPPLQNTTLRFPRGAVVNARYFKKCSQSVLERKGPSGCPASSKIGVGTATGDARPVVGNVNAKVTLYNGEAVHRNPTILIYAQPEISSPLTITGELKRQRTGPYGYVLDVDVPPIPTLPGQPNASVVFFDARTLDRTVRRRGRRIHYIEGPILCNGTFFLLDGAFTYEGGVTHTVYERFTLRGGPRCP